MWTTGSACFSTNMCALGVSNEVILRRLRITIKSVLRKQAMYMYPEFRWNAFWNESVFLVLQCDWPRVNWREGSTQWNCWTFLPVSNETLFFGVTFYEWYHYILIRLRWIKAALSDYFVISFLGHLNKLWLLMKCPYLLWLCSWNRKRQLRLGLVNLDIKLRSTNTSKS